MLRLRILAVQLIVPVLAVEHWRSGFILWESYDLSTPDLSYIVLQYVEVALRVARRHHGERKTVCKEK